MRNESLEQKLRSTVVGTEQKVPLLNGSYVTAVNFDNGATTPPLCSVMREINRFVPWYSSVHRGTGYKSLLSSDLYEAGRQEIKEFVGADPEDCLIYTKSTTESINLLADAFHRLNPEAVILSTWMEHLANDLPWRSRFCLDYVLVDRDGKLDLDDLERKLILYQGKVKLLALTGASNVTGYINPIHEAAAIVHRYGAEIFVDGAQLVPHRAVQMKSRSSMDHIDYLAFSAHKMYAPFGIGILIGAVRTFAGNAPFLQGGGAVKLVGHDFVDWDDPPYRQEAGTPNVIGAAALLKAIRSLQRIGMERIHTQEQELIDYIIDGLRGAPGIGLYGCPKRAGDKVSIISFTLQGLHHRMIARILSYEYGIAVRSGLFCAHPYVQRLLGMSAEEIHYYRQHEKVPFPGLVRISLGLYNRYEEADRLLCGVWEIASQKESFLKKYQQIDLAPAYANSPLLNPVRRQLP